MNEGTAAERPAAGPSALGLEPRDGVAILWLDQPGSRVNTLGLELLDELPALLDRIEADPALRAVVFASRKPENFIAGADIKLFSGLAAELPEVIRRGHELFARLERFPKPVVAAVHGACAGGGLELALACHYRLASASPRTSFSLPEVKLGLLPGLGGTQRLPRLVGLRRALAMMLEGGNVYAKPALRMGLVDALHHEEGLLGAALAAAHGLADGVTRRRPRRKPLEAALERGPASALVYRRAERLVRRRTRGNYPAPARIIDAVRTGLERGVPAGLEAEARHFTELLATPEARALIHLFFAQNEARKNRAPGATREVRTVGVLGAGLMGAGIAQVSAQSGGYRVLLKDRTFELAARGKAGAYRDLSGRVGKGMTAFERDVTAERIVPTSDYEPFAAADLTVEAVLESLEVKHQVLRETEAVTRPGHVFATNTSSIPIREIAAAAARPEDVLGMHYFSPVQKMPLLEVIRGPRTSDEALATAVQVGLAQGKTVIVVGDRPGFYVNRILAPYLNEALLLLGEGAGIREVDDAMRDAGFPVGPFKLLDEVGLDVAGSVTRVLAPLFAERGLELVQAGDALRAAGLTGRKGGRGFYRYEGGKSGAPNPDAYRALGAAARREVPSEEIRERLLLIMMNEAVHCLEEGIISGPTDGDVGAVFGIGFPPFLGGPFWHLDRLGAGATAARLGRLRERHGERFAPAPRLERLAEAGERFYGAAGGA